MTIKKELLEIPHALQQMSEEGRPLYDALVRRISWSEGRVFMIADGSSHMAALTGAWAFESLLRLPVILRRPAVFSAYTSSALAARSLLIVMSASGACEETMQAAKKAKKQGATVWAVTGSPESELAKLAHATVNYYPAESSAEGSRSVFCQHAVMVFLAVAAARILRTPGPLLSGQEEELGKLAQHVEWVLNQISDAARALAKEIVPLSHLSVVGAGPFHPVALQAAYRLRQLAGVRASGFELLHFHQAVHQVLQPDSGILYLSSSRCRLKAQVHQSVREARQKRNRKIFAVTDSNDRQLSERAELAVLLPILTETSAALVSLAFLDLVTHYAAQASAHRTS